MPLWLKTDYKGQRLIYTNKGWVKRSDMGNAIPVLIDTPAVAAEFIKVMQPGVKTKIEVERAE